MKRKSIVLLAAAVLCVVLAVLYFSLRPGAEKDPEEAGQEPLLSVSDPVRVDYRFDDYRYTLEKDAQGEWRCEQYAGFSVDPSFVAGLVERMNSLTAIAVLQEQDSLEEYGITPQSDYLEIEDAAGQTLRLVVGKELPYDEALYFDGEGLVGVAYLYLSERDTVFTGYTSFVSYASKPFEEIVAYEPPRGFSPSDVSRVSISTQGMQYVMAPDGEQGEWTLKKEGVKLEADEKTLSSILTLIRYIHPLSCYAYAVNDTVRSACGLAADPYLAIVVELVEEPAITLWVGEIAENQAGEYNAKRYMLCDGQDRILVCYEKNAQAVLDAVWSCDPGRP